MTATALHARKRLSTVNSSREIPSRRRSARRLLAFAASAAALNLGQRAFAQATNTWNGGAGNWNIPGNWSAGTVPNSGTTSVFIDGGNVLNSAVTLNISASVNNITLDSGDHL